MTDISQDGIKRIFNPLLSSKVRAEIRQNLCERGAQKELLAETLAVVARGVAARGTIDGLIRVILGNIDCLGKHEAALAVPQLIRLLGNSFAPHSHEIAKTLDGILPGWRESEMAVQERLRILAALSNETDPVQIRALGLHWSVEAIEPLRERVHDPRGTPEVIVEALETILGARAGDVPAAQLECLAALRDLETIVTRKMADMEMDYEESKPVDCTRLVGLARDELKRRGA